MAERKHKRSLLNVLITNVPGARSYVLLIFLQLMAFLIAVMFSSYLFIKAIQLGKYANSILNNNIHIIIVLWIIFPRFTKVFNAGTSSFNALETASVIRCVKVIIIPSFLLTVIKSSSSVTSISTDPKIFESTGFL